MKHKYLTLILVCLLQQSVFSQTEMLEVSGAVVIQDAEIIPSIEGTINWSGIDVNGWDGTAWRSMTGEGLIYDVDSNGYHVVAVGKQLWMKENLRTSKYADGTPIPNEVINETWRYLTDGAFCWYFNDPIHEIPYGKLYNWYAAADPRGLCPNGWHIPTETDFLELSNFLSQTAGGGRMKEPGTIHWLQPNTGANNESNLNVVPGGYRTNYGNFVSKAGLSFFWSSTSAGTISAKYLEVRHDNEEINIGTTLRILGNSIRCIKD